jgi:hypothetical protein
MDCTPKVRHGKLGTVLYGRTHVQEIPSCFQSRIQA